jgi:hypothetical protein
LFLRRFFHWALLFSGDLDLASLLLAFNKSKLNAFCRNIAMDAWLPQVSYPAQVPWFIGKALTPWFAWL